MASAQRFLLRETECLSDEKKKPALPHRSLPGLMAFQNAAELKMKFHNGTEMFQNRVENYEPARSTVLLSRVSLSARLIGLIVRILTSNLLDLSVDTARRKQITE